MTRADFNSFVHNVSRILYGHAYRILRDQQGSEDAVQEVLVKLWKMNTRLDEYESVSALAVTMVKNHCIDQLRKLKHYGPADGSYLVLQHDPQPSPHERLERNESYGLINKIIDQLPEMYRELIQMKDIDGLSYEEVAVIKGQNINTLRVNLSRARKLVRDEYKKYYNESGGNKTIA
ncbi:MAG: sigma-70 family RNA polymerase sigma factor [Bacteroidota bacterium]|nr:sigma-70 family RNA polymerase sigma factor [Bacteroidota bacterium]